MKIVILNNDFRVYWKGRLLYLQQFLAGYGIKLYAIELFGKGSPYSFDTTTQGHSWWTCLFPDNAAAELSKVEIKKALNAKLDVVSPDIVIGPSIVFFSGALGICWAKNHEKKFIMFDDAKPSQIKRNFLVQQIKDFIIAQTDSLWLPSKRYDYEYRWFTAKGVRTVHGFSTINNNQFKPDETHNPEYRTIVCVARLVSIKNIDKLLTAWQLVEDKNTGYTLHIIGNGPEESTLKQLNLQLGLKNVRFTDALVNEALPGYLKRSGAFILPSLTETWGLVVNEAMAAGLPVLLSNEINAAGDLLQEGVNGFGFDPYNVLDIASAILKYINLSNEAKADMSKASLKLVDAFSYHNMAEKLLAELTSLNAKPFKKPGIISKLVLNLWHGRHNTAGWDNLANNIAKW